ncbi:hypothetical protein M0R04_08305 [Candidatus Dojkabacteria bacterium]|jgi:hypothetical protein|nr:hypothetical protein [Candidatus Dojkabacteria bacterium]
MDNQQAESLLNQLVNNDNYSGLGLGNFQQLRASTIYNNYGGRNQYYLRDYKIESNNRFITREEAINLIARV